VNREHGAVQTLFRLAISLVTAVFFLAATAGAANATVPLEGVWSFNGGKIAIHPDGSEGNLVGTVIAATTFADCPHQVGEDIWTGITAQGDGSWWGLHQWFYENASCPPNPELGATAFRILTNSSGRYLRVCLSEPGSGQQPTIAADGKSAGATFGCLDSELIADLPSSSDLKPGKLIKLPSNAECLARRTLRVQIHDPSGDSIVKAKVTVSGGGVVRQAKVVKKGKGEVAIVHPGAIPSNQVVVSVTLKTALGHTVRTKRTYRRCGVTKSHRQAHRAHA
jgi:hypothetical protein